MPAFTALMGELLWMRLTISSMRIQISLTSRRFHLNSAPTHFGIVKTISSALCEEWMRRSVPINVHGHRLSSPYRGFIIALIPDSPDKIGPAGLKAAETLAKLPISSFTRRVCQESLPYPA
jgi:hypothetical protein